MPADTRALLAAVESWLQANYPGRRIDYLTIHVQHCPVPIQLLGGAAAATVPAVAEEPEEEQDERGGRGLSRCVVDILQTLREVKKPLSRTRLMEEMERRSRFWGDSTVAAHLAKMVQDGTLLNPEGQRRGYRLSEWEEATDA